MSSATRKFCQIRFVVEGVRDDDADFPKIVLVRWKRTECRIAATGFPLGDFVFVPNDDSESLQFSLISANRTFRSEISILGIQNEPKRIHFEAKTQNGDKIGVQMVIQKIPFSQISPKADFGVQTDTVAKSSKESQRFDFSANSVPATAEFGTQTEMTDSISPRQRQIIVRTIYILIHRLQSRLLEYQMNERTQRNKNTKTKSTNTEMSVPPKAAIPTKSPKTPPIAQMRERLRKIAETHWTAKNRQKAQPKFQQRRQKKIEEKTPMASAVPSEHSEASNSSRSSDSHGTSESTENSSNQSLAESPPVGSSHRSEGSQSTQSSKKSKRTQQSEQNPIADAEADSIAESIAEEIMSNRLSEIHSSALGSLDSVRTASDSSLARN